MKIAIVHDWLVTYAGAERVLEQMLHCFPEADLFAVIDFFDENLRHQHLLGKRAKTTFIQKLPLAKKKYRTYLPLMPLAIEQLDLSAYDLIISSSHAVAKGVITSPNQLHISYIYSPMRYAWDLQHQYLKESGLSKKFFTGGFARYFLHRLRIWDYCSSARVDYFIADSHYIAKRIQKIYRREAAVIYPAIDLDFFDCCLQKENFYLTISRLVPYKRIDLIAEAFIKMPDKKLIIIGDGPELKKIKLFAEKAQNIIFLGYQQNEIIRDYMQRAKAFVFAAEEDFGIVPIEAQACGTPVIAYGKGGALETVMGVDSEKPAGLFFYEQTVEAIVEAVKQFEKKQQHIKSENCRQNAERFSVECFRKEFSAFIGEAWKNK